MKKFTVLTRSKGESKQLAGRSRFGMPLPLIVGAVTLTSGLWKWATAEPDYEAGTNAALDSAGAPERAVGCAFSDSTECAAVLDIVGAVMAADAATAWAAGETDDDGGGGGGGGGTARDDAVTASVGLMSPRGSAATAAAAAAAAAVFDPAASPGWRSLGLRGGEGCTGQAGGNPGGGGAALTDAACEVGWALASDLLARAKKAGRAVVLVAGARAGDRKHSPGGESNDGGAAGGEGEGGDAAREAAARARMSGVLLLQRLAPGVAPTSHAGVHTARDAAAAVRARGPVTAARVAHVAAVRARLHSTAAPRSQSQSHSAGGVAAAAAADAAAAAAAPRARFHILAVAPSIGGVPHSAAQQWAAWRGRRGPSGPEGADGDARRAFESSPRALRARDEDANAAVDQLLKAAVALADAAGAELLCESSAPHRLLPLLLRHGFTVRNELPLTGACIAAAPGARAAALNLLGLAREPRRPSLPPRVRQQGPDGSHAEPGPAKPAAVRAEQEEPVRATTPLPPPPPAATAATAPAAEMAAGAPASDEDIDGGSEAAEEDVVLHSEADPVDGADGSGAVQGGSAALIASAVDPVVACAVDGANANAAEGGKRGVAVPTEPGSSDGNSFLAAGSERGGGKGKDGGDGHVEDEDEDDVDSESSNDEDEDDDESDEDYGVVLVSESALQTVAVAATTDVHAV